MDADASRQNDPAKRSRSTLRQIWLLTRKNFIVIWRSKLWFLCELSVGLLLLPLIAIIVSTSKTDVSRIFSHQAVRVTGNNEDLTRIVHNIGTIWKTWCSKPQSLAYVYVNLLRVAKVVGAPYDEALFSAPSSELEQSLVEAIRKRVEGRYNRKLTWTHFANVEKMMAALREDLNRTQNAICGKIMGGIHFRSIGKNPPTLDYRFMIPQRGETVGSSMPVTWKSDFWPADGPYTPVADINWIPGQPGYWSTGFLSVQFAIESGFLELANKSSTLDQYDVYLQRMPTPQFRNSGIIMFLKSTPLVWSLLALMSMIHTAKNIVEEKESGIKTYMMVMGMQPLAFYASHFIIGYLKVGIPMAACAIYLSTGFEAISPTLFTVFSMLFAFSALLIAVLISVIVKRSSLAIISILGAWITLVVTSMYMDVSLNSVAYCFLASFNVVMAFKLGVKSASSFETRSLDLGWTSLFQEFPHSFTVGWALVMLLVDCAIMIFLIYYLDAIRPTDDSPRKHPLFIFRFINSSIGQVTTPRMVEQGQGEDQVDNATVESEAGLSRDEADIDIRHLSKVWPTGRSERTKSGSSEIVAVDDLNFRAYRGQVTVLLGHNGAGKSTTFAVISGVASGSSGEVLICQENIDKHLHSCQRQIGYCPQYNPLFPLLTVREQLRLYARLKKGNGESGTAIEQDIETLAKDVMLEAKLDVLTGSLSGGMKRKLCVAMALIGESRVILLDEPTAGMDPEARNDIRQLLERTKKHRTILLTTHYMDEADSLGDRIGIMVTGRLICSGSPEFLKNKYGTGYKLSVTMQKPPVELEIDTPPFSPRVDAVMQVLRKHAPDAKLEKSRDPEFTVIIPMKYKRFFADMFEELEEQRDSLGLNCFGLSLNTLEQVFLKVGEGAAKNGGVDETDFARTARNASELRQHNEYSQRLIGLLSKQMGALIVRHYLSTMRNQLRTFVPICISLLLFVLFGSVGRIFFGHRNTVRDLSLPHGVPPITIPLLLHNYSTTQPDLAFIAGKVPNSLILPVPSSKHVDLQSVLLQHAYDSPPLGFGAAVFPNKSSTRPYSAHMLFNGIGPHTPPLALELFTNAILKDEGDSIHLSMEWYDVPATTDAEVAALLQSISNIFVSLLVVLAFSLITSTFVEPLVEDRQRMFKSQMLLTELTPLVYWISVTVWNAIVYTVYCATLILIFFIFGWLRNSLWSYITLWALYFWCCAPFVYCASFLFDVPIKAFTALSTWNIVMVLIAMVFSNLAGFFVSDALRKVLYDVAYLVLPSFPLGDGMMKIAIMSSIPGEHDVWQGDTSQPTLMLTSGAIFWTLLFVLESKRVKRWWHQLSCHIQRSVYQRMYLEESEGPEDVDVADERRRIRQGDDRGMALAVHDLYKYYGPLCAVRNLTFGVDRGECFGLLGVNGAGKTTTFDILTGNALSSSGSANIEGVDVGHSPTIGYCPQFDALPLELTGRETLVLLARLCGFKKAKKRADDVLKGIDMVADADRQIQHYSGGQKRRISIGVALILRASLMMLDEPTAGIDPKTRRNLWDLLRAVKEQSRVSILLTSHSMDECEALCDRIGFMNKGSLIGIGTPQHLKSRYGSSYMVSITVANPKPSIRRFLDGLMSSEFKIIVQALVTDDSADAAILHWEIPREINPSWSILWRKMQSIADRFPPNAHYSPMEDREGPLIVDFSVAQNSLEQVFLRLATGDTELEQQVEAE